MELDELKLATLNNDAYLEKLIELGVVDPKNPISSFKEFLVKREAAKKYNNEATVFSKLDPSFPDQARCFSFHNRKDYGGQGQPISYAEWCTNLYLMSVSGGRTIIDAYGKLSKSEDNKPLPNPLNVEQIPASNITVVTQLPFTGYGGYFNRTRKEYDSPQLSTLVLAYAIEFENLTVEDIKNNKCQFLTMDGGDDTQVLKVRYKDEGFCLDGGQAIYLNTKEYKNFVKTQLLNQMRALVLAHQQSGLTDNIRLNLTLPGLGYFSQLGGNRMFSIKADLAPYAAEAFREAVGIFGKEQNSRQPKITEMRISYNNRWPNDEGKAIEKVFVRDPIEIRGIKVTKTTQTVENFEISPGIINAVFVNGDPRAKGNEQKPETQEPGTFANTHDGRNKVCVLIDPCQLVDLHDHEEVKNLLAKGNNNLNKLDVEKNQQLRNFLDKASENFPTFSDKYPAEEVSPAPQQAASQKTQQTSKAEIVNNVKQAICQFCEENYGVNLETTEIADVKFGPGKSLSVFFKQVGEYATSTADAALGWALEEVGISHKNTGNLSVIISDENADLFLEKLENLKKYGVERQTVYDAFPDYQQPKPQEVPAIEKNKQDEVQKNEVLPADVPQQPKPQEIPVIEGKKEEAQKTEVPPAVVQQQPIKSCRLPAPLPQNANDAQDCFRLELTKTQGGNVFLKFPIAHKTVAKGFVDHHMIPEFTIRAVSHFYPP